MKQRLQEVLSGRSRPALLGAVLRMLSMIYGPAMRARAALYRSGILSTKRLPCPVVSVGNITMGGTGKTPAAISIANLLRSMGRRPAVVSRGYGRRRERDLLVVSDGARRFLGPSLGGDEPVLIAERSPGVPVIVGADRFRAGMLAVERSHPDVIVLDDGFQHIRLKRDLNIALVDAQDPFGNGLLFPAGILREHPRELRRADVVVITRVDESSDPGGLVHALRSLTTAAIFTAGLIPTGLVGPSAGEERSPAVLRGAKVAAFAGIARPGSFFGMLRGLGADLQECTAFPDHHAFTEEDLLTIRRRAKTAKADLIVTTEKDLVRLEGTDRSGIWALRIEQCVREQDAWNKLLAERL